MPMKFLTAAIICAALLPTALAGQTSQTPKTWAVVIGISKYQKLPGGQQLQFADRDAALFSESIQKRGVSAQNIKLLTGTDATAARIKSAIGDWLARSVNEADTVLIFFSGHGFFERQFGESYLLAYDSDPRTPYSTALSVNDIGQALVRRVRSGRVLVIADALRRDFFEPETDPNSSKAFEQAFDQLTALRPGLSAIIANSPGEFSREGQRWGGHGVFAKHLTDVLLDGASRAGDLAIATEELFELLRGRVSEDTSGKQRPWRSGKSPAQVGAARDTAQNTNAAPSTPQRVITPERPKEVASSKGPEPSPNVARQPELVIKNMNKPVNSEPVAGETNKGSSPPKAQPPVNPVKKAQPSSQRKTSVTQDVRTSARSRRGNKENIANKEKTKPPARTRRSRSRPTTAKVGKPEVTAPRVSKPETTARAPLSNPGSGAKPSGVRQTAPPVANSVKTNQPDSTPGELARTELAVLVPAAPPRPSVRPPGAVTVTSDRAGAQPEVVTTSVPAARPEAGPSPLVLQLEAAIASGTLIEPKNDSAWDFYQRMLSEPGVAADAARLKPALATALAAQGRAIVEGDVRSDNIADKVDDFRRAGQMLARARTLAHESSDITVLEKLSAAGALISLQFYDEAERALAPLQTSKLAAVENALGLVYHGKLDTFRAERAFKRACEIDSKWAAPHYNLATLYRSQQNPAALAEFEAAASRDQSNVQLMVALGDEYFGRQEWKQAADAFRKAVALKPSDDNLHTKLGHALYSQGLQDEANREYQKARELRAKRP